MNFYQLTLAFAGVIQSFINSMGIIQFGKRQVEQIKQGGGIVLVRKLKLISGNFLKLWHYKAAILPLFIIRLIRPWVLVRIGLLNSSRIGHFAANTELYLCEQDSGINVPNKRHIDIFYLDDAPICNQQLAIMWKRVLRIWPTWIMARIAGMNRLIPGGALHEIRQTTQHDRDVHSLLNQLPSHLHFTAEEENRGIEGLKAMGIPIGGLFVCLSVRDSKYLSAHLSQSDFSYHNYRDTDIQNYRLVAEELGKRGYFVIRMGAKVEAALKSNHPKVIDYATNGMRSDFMDIYLGAKCTFFISAGSGFDAIPTIFRRPVVAVNVVPLGYSCTWRNGPMITKHHIDNSTGCKLSLNEIFSRGVGYCLKTSDYQSKNVSLIENTPEEICDVAIEMADRLAGTWQVHPDDEALQQRFWKVFPADAVDAYEGKPLHGEIRARFGAAFLYNNRDWLQ